MYNVLIFLFCCKYSWLHALLCRKDIRIINAVKVCWCLVFYRLQFIISSVKTSALLFFFHSTRIIDNSLLAQTSSQLLRINLLKSVACNLGHREWLNYWNCVSQSEMCAYVYVSPSPETGIFLTLTQTGIKLIFHSWTVWKLEYRWFLFYTSAIWLLARSSRSGRGQRFWRYLTWQEIYVERRFV